MADYSYLNRSELVQLLISQKSELGKQMVKTEPTNQEAKQNLNAYKLKLETEIKAIEAKLKETVTIVAPSASTDERKSPAAPSRDRMSTLISNSPA